MKTPRDTALELLLRIERGGAYIDRVLASQALDAYDGRDRAFIRELVNGVTRWKLRLDAVIDSRLVKPAGMSPKIRMILRLGLYQIEFMNVPAHAVVNEAVNAARALQGGGAGGLVNAVLRRCLREGTAVPDSADPAERLAVEHSHPLWLVKRWTARYGGEETVRIMQAGNERHPVFVRANPLRTNPDDLFRALGDLGFEPEAVGGMYGFLAVREPEGLFLSAPFADGLFIVQDPAAEMPVQLLDPRPGDSILDLCAAPGGKTAVAAWTAHDSGRVLALDINPGRVRLVEETIRRLGLSSVETAVGDAAVWEPPNDERFDRVLLDAPCSGTAVFSKRPDMKWRLAETDIRRLASLQEQLLDRAAELVKPGGLLVYGTCTLETEENEETVRRFLGRNVLFAAEQDDRYGAYAAETGYLIPPHRMHGAGAFAAKMRRTSDGS